MKFSTPFSVRPSTGAKFFGITLLVAGLVSGSALAKPKSSIQEMKEKAQARKEERKEAKEERKEARKEKLEKKLEDMTDEEKAAFEAKRAERKEERAEVRAAWKDYKEKRKERRKARREELKEKLGDDIKRPVVKTELTLHARRMAKLNRIRVLAKADGKDALVTRVDGLITKEKARHDKRVAALKAKKDGEE